MRNFLWIIAEIGVFLVWKNAERHVGKKNRKKMGEVDFVVEHNGEVFPIEVKSGKDYARHRALNNILDCSEYNIPESVVLCNDNYTQKDKVIYAPIYMVMFIHKDTAFLTHSAFHIGSSADAAPCGACR